MVDIDASELEKPTLDIDLKINTDIRIFLDIFLEKLQKIEIPDFISWKRWCNNIKGQLPTLLEDNPSDNGYVSSYLFVDRLFEKLPSSSVVITGNGTAYTCTYQAMKIKEGMRVIANQGCASMGYALPAGIGACVARDMEETIVITGDGSIMMNLQELQTITSYNLPLKIFLIENNGYVAIRTTQKAFFNGRFVGESPESRMSVANFEKIAKAFDIKFFAIESELELDKQLETVLKEEGPLLCLIKMDPHQTLFPKVASVKLPDGKIISKPIEKMAPFLSEEVDVLYRLD